MEKPTNAVRFSIRDLLVATALIAVGMAGLAYIFGGPETGPFPIWLWFFSGACIGAGALTPFKRPIVGAVCGLVIQLGLALA